MEWCEPQKDFIDQAKLALESAEVALARLELAYRASHPLSAAEVAEAQAKRRRTLITRYARLAETLEGEFILGPLDEDFKSDLVAINSVKRGGQSWYVLLERFAIDVTIEARWDEDEPEPESDSEAGDIVGNALADTGTREVWEAAGFAFDEQCQWTCWRTDDGKPTGIARVYSINASRPLASMADALAVCRWLKTADFKIRLPD